jgi:23S rRNA G2445 N2-methylase RlmL
MNTLRNLVVTCTPRTAPFLHQEIVSLGYPNAEEGKMSVKLQGTMEDAMRLNLWLRTGNRVLLEIDHFTASTPDELYQQAVKLPWETWIDKEGYVSIDSFVKNDNIRDTRFANLKLKDALVDRMKEKNQVRPNSGPEHDRSVVYMYWVDEECTLYFDTSGKTISKHGYREITVKAPMMESLAAAAIFASGWDTKTSFVNPMCGSGTLAIEAALMATQMPPDWGRKNYGFMHLKEYDAALWEKIRKEAKAGFILEPKVRIVATDRDKKAIEAARTNARKANVDHLIEFKVCDFTRTDIPQENKGIVILNPEYGERLGELEELEGVYKSIGDFFKQECKGYTGFVFTGNLDAAKRIGLKPKRRIEFYNARIDCRLLQFELYEGSKRVREEEISE